MFCSRKPQNHSNLGVVWYKVMNNPEKFHEILLSGLYIVEYGDLTDGRTDVRITILPCVGECKINSNIFLLFSHGNSRISKGKETCFFIFTLITRD